MFEPSRENAVGDESTLPTSIPYMSILVLLRTRNASSWSCSEQQTHHLGLVAKNKRIALVLFRKHEQVLLQEGGGNNIFSGLTRAQFRDARHTIVQAILGTDMSSHMEHCADLFQFAQKAERQSADEDRGRAPGRLEHAASGLAGDAGGALDGAAVPPPSPPWRVFCVRRPEDRCFLTKTVVHWCVRLLLNEIEE